MGYDKRLRAYCYCQHKQNNTIDRVRLSHVLIILLEHNNYLFLLYTVDYKYKNLSFILLLLVEI